MFPSLQESQAELLGLVGTANWREPKPLDCYDLIVLGGGTAGLVSAVGAASLGARVALIERNLLGGDCLHTGCVPSKALLAAGRVINKIQTSKPFGVSVGSIDIDYKKTLQRMSGVQAALAKHDSVERLSGLGVHVFFGSPVFESKNYLALGTHKLRFRRSIIATGSKSWIPPIPGLEVTPYLTTSTLFQLEELPRNLIVLGGGPAGCELAQVFKQLGSLVTLVEQSTRLISHEDSVLSDRMRVALESSGVTVRLNTKATDVSKSASGVRLGIESDGKPSSIEGTHLLVVTGRRPNTHGLQLESAGVQYDTISGVHVTSCLQSTNRRIYAAGDVCSKLMFTHAADLQARIVVRNSLFWGRERYYPSEVPYCIYTCPEMAHVGIHETDEKHRLALDTVSIDLQESDRANLDGTSGVIQVHLKRGTDRILGASVVAERASELISQFAFAIKNRIGLVKLGSNVQPYPTYGNAVRKLADQFNRRRLTPRALRMINKWHAFNRAIDA